MKTAPQEGDLRVWHIPQIPARTKDDTFRVPVKSLREAQLVLDVLSSYDLFQLDTDIKPDFSNASGLQIYHDNEWEDWHDEESDMSEDEYFDEHVKKEDRVYYTMKFKNLNNL